MGEERTAAAVAQVADVVARRGDEAQVHQAVRDARQAGATWKQLSAVLGISKADAKERFGPPDAGE